MADKIIVSKSKVTNLFDSIRAKSGSTDLISFDNAKSTVDEIQTGGGVIEVEELPKVGWSGTSIPNSGYVDKVYFNTELSVEEVVSLLSGLEYNPNMGNQYNILISMAGNEAIQIYARVNDEMFSVEFARMNMGNGQISEYYTIFDNTNYNGFNNDINNPIEINAEVISEMQGMLFGTQNSQLSSLFSTTPFVKEEPVEGSIYKVIPTGTVVPNSGVVNKVYFNNELSIETTVSLLKKLTYTSVMNAEMYFLLSNSSSTCNLVVTHAHGTYGITDAINSLPIFCDKPNDEVDFVGWNPNISFEFNINDTVLNTYANLISVGEENNFITSLFSLTPFTKLKLYIYKNGEFVELSEGSGGGEESTDMLQMLLNKYDGKRFFYYWYHSSLDGIDNLDFSNISTAEDMFSNASTLESISNNKINLQNVTTMYNMFNACNKLATPLELYTTSKLTNLDSAFNGCWALPSVVISDTSKVTTWYYSFRNCSAIVSISTLDMNSAVRISSDIFKGCKVLENLILKNIQMSITIGSGTTYGHLLTLDSLINTCKECIKQSSSKTLTIGSANLEKLANVYVKPATDDEFIIEVGEKGEVVVCESTDDGAMTIMAYMTLKNWTLA